MERQLGILPDLIVGIQDLRGFFVDHAGEKFQVFIHVRFRPF